MARDYFAADRAIIWSARSASSLLLITTWGWFSSSHRISPWLVLKTSGKSVLVLVIWGWERAQLGHRDIDRRRVYARERSAGDLLAARGHRADRAITQKLREGGASVAFRHVDMKHQAATNRRLSDMACDLRVAKQFNDCPLVEFFGIPSCRL